MLVLILGSKKYVLIETKRAGCAGCCFKLSKRMGILKCRLRNKGTVATRCCNFFIGNENYIWKKV